VCTDAEADVQRLFAPIATGAIVEGEVLASSGRCVLECNSNDDCEEGDTCNAGTCGRERGSCRTRDDCEGGFACTSEIAGQDRFVTAAAADGDGDGLVDPIDNCPEATLEDGSDDQADADADGIGDLCDTANCGDGDLASGEACDDGNLESGDGCSASCVVEECRNGLDDDLDGRIDTGFVPGFAYDPGCSSPDDLSERASSGLPCDDGVDDDGDGLVDQADPGCRWWSWPREDPKCDNGLDDDGDGGTDWDGAGVGPPDPACVGKPWRDRETTGCGLGFEIAPLLAPLLWLRRRRGAAPRGRDTTGRSAS
jgi:cysteine-rich repeat protein